MIFTFYLLVGRANRISFEAIPLFRLCLLFVDQDTVILVETIYQQGDLDLLR